MDIEEDEIIRQCKDIISAIKLQGYLNDEERNSIIYLQGLIDLFEKEKETSHYIQSQLDIANAKVIEINEKLDKLLMEEINNE